MAPIPPLLIRLATVFLTQALTRRLQQSPAFFRVVDRLIHEIDHLPNRMQGRPMPYRRIDPQEPTLSEQAQDAWNHRVDDPGEPHDLPNPFANPSATAAQPSSSAPPGQMSRDRARQSIHAGQRNAQQARDRRKAEDGEAKRDAKMDDMRSVLERLRETKDRQ